MNFKTAAHDRGNSIKDVAEIFGLSDRTVARMIKRGDLKAERLSARCVRVFDSEIERYRRERNAPSAA